MNRLTFCALFASAVLFSFTTSVLGQPYELPVRGDDLSPGQRFKTSNHGGDNQTQGKDIGARRHVSDSDWSKFVSNGGSVVYNKPFYAIAPGRVFACWRNAPDNPSGGRHPMVLAERIPGGGNHLWIRQDDGNAVLYAHASPGSIPPNLCPHNGTFLTDSTLTGSNPQVRRWAAVTSGARVTTGQFLGRIGNSGESDGAHLHIHMERDNSPVVMTFRRGLTTSFADETASLSGPWRRLDGGAMPNADILIWPPRPVGNWRFNGTKGKQFQALFDHMTDSGMMPKRITCTSGGETYNSTWEPSSGAWHAEHHMSAVEAATKHAELVSQGFRRTSNFTCGSVKVMVWRKPRVVVR